MSDSLAAAAAALGMPEDLTRRSAEARAAETGSSVDEILSAWAGGEPVAAISPDEEPDMAPAASPDEEPEVTSEKPVATPDVVIEPAPGPVSSVPAAPSGPRRPPVLVGATDKPGTIIVGVIALFLVVLMMGLIGPSVSADEPGARTSDIIYSALALDGQAVYSKLGCASCHTQMVRPVIADVGLGPVTLNDSNQVLGARRFGPDLADIGTRMTPSQLHSTVTGDTTSHPQHDLADKDITALVAYLSESRTSGG